MTFPFTPSLPLYPHLQIPYPTPPQVTVRPDCDNGAKDGKRTWSEAKEGAGWGEGAPWGKRQWQIASLMAQASGQENERWSTAQVGRGPWVVVSVDGLDMSFSQTFIYVTASDVRWWRVDGGRLGSSLS